MLLFLLHVVFFPLLLLLLLLSLLLLLPLLQNDEDDDRIRLVPAFANTIIDKDGSKVRYIDIDIITLDDFAAQRGWLGTATDTTQQQPQRIEILKVDVESHEAQVLLGATKLLATKQIRHVFVEYTINKRN